MAIRLVLRSHSSINASSSANLPVLQSVSGYSHALMPLLRIPPHTIWSFLIHLCIGFFMSGFFHALSLSTLAPYPPKVHIFKSNLFFFMAQVLAIIFERVIIKSFKPYFVEAKDQAGWKTGLRRIYLKFLGHFWVIGWLLFSGWSFWDVYYRLGMATWQMPIPVVETILARARYQAVA
jgi:hypothetical protein